MKWQATIRTEINCRPAVTRVITEELPLLAERLELDLFGLRHALAVQADKQKHGPLSGSILIMLDRLDSPTRTSCG